MCALEGESDVIVGRTSSAVALVLGTPFTVTTMVPVLAPAGTTAWTCVSLQLGNVVAGVPLNVSVLLPCVAPRFLPGIVTVAPTGAGLGVTESIAGVASTLNVTAGLVCVPTVTVTGALPRGRLKGTCAVMLEADQLKMPAVVPENFTVPD